MPRSSRLLQIEQKRTRSCRLLSLLEAFIRGVGLLGYPGIVAVITAGVRDALDFQPLRTFGVETFLDQGCVHGLSLLRGAPQPLVGGTFVEQGVFFAYSVIW